MVIVPVWNLYYHRLCCVVDLVLGSLSISRQVCAQPSSQLRHDHLDAHLLLALDGALDGRLLDAMLMLMSMLPTAIALDAVAVVILAVVIDHQNKNPQVQTS
ncbi:MAG: hypothetical protein ABSA16_17410 [Thermoguttaceae bacterium]